MSCFFNHLKNIGGKGITVRFNIKMYQQVVAKSPIVILDGSTDPWVEYHHPDFFQKEQWSLMSLQKRSFIYIGLVCTASFGDNILISYQDNPHAEIPKGKNSKFFKLCQTLKMPYRLRKQDTNDKGKRRRSDRLIPVSCELCIQNRPHSRWWQTSAASTVQCLLVKIKKFLSGGFSSVRI